MPGPDEHAAAVLVTLVCYVRILIMVSAVDAVLQVSVVMVLNAGGRSHVMTDPVIEVNVFHWIC